MGSITVRAGCLALAVWVFPARSEPPPEASPPAVREARILGVIPNYQTVSDPSQPAPPPMTGAQKRRAFLRESTDPFNLAGAVLGAGLSQAANAHPRYGQGGGAFADRFAAASADMATQVFFTNAVLAPLLHQDIRYYRKGPGVHPPPGAVLGHPHVHYPPG